MATYVLPTIGGAAATPLYNQVVVMVPPVDAEGVAVSVVICPGNKVVNGAALKSTVGTALTVIVMADEVSVVVLRQALPPVIVITTSTLSLFTREVEVQVLDAPLCTLLPFLLKL